MTENEISGKIISKAIELHNALGPGLLEHVYTECLFYTLNKTGLFIEKEKPMPLVFEEVRLDCGYRLDLLVERRVVIEVKSVEALSEIHFAQTLTYLRLGDFKLGLLINFNVPFLKDGIRRIVNNL